jgi:predicted DNA-binding transcriptional regulator AlpA
MSQKIKFTSSWVDALPFATDEHPRLEFRDSETQGLVLRVGKGSKTYFLVKRMRVRGRSVERKVKLGLTSQLTPQGARRAVAKYSQLEAVTARKRGAINTSEAIRLDEEMLTTEEAAELTRMSCAWFERKRWEGQGGPPFYRAGRAVRYMKSELLEWWKQRAGA